MADKLGTKTTQEWRELLEPLGIPVLPAHTFESLIDDPHLQDIGFFQQYEHPTEGTLRTMAVPSEWPQTPLPPLRPPPLVGEHSAQILAEAGYSPQQIREMVETGVTHLQRKKLLHRGDWVVAMAGTTTRSGGTNLLRILQLGRAPDVVPANTPR